MSGARPDAPPAVGWITRTLEKAGYETWTVGGAVRDALRRQPSGDWDLATRARPNTVRELFPRTVPIGIDHGTVGILARDGTLYEITTFRKDIRTDGRHAVVEFAETLEEDLARRDFTINAVAWHAIREELFDPFGGAEDLDARLLRTVGEPSHRFREDHLRILRALRFAGRFELEIDPPTWEAARSLVTSLPRLSPERIREELFKVLGDDPNPARSLDLYAECGALGVLYGELDELRARNPSAWTDVLSVVDHLPTGRPALRLAALLRSLEAEGVAATLLRLRLSNAMVDEVARLAGSEPLPDPGASDAVFRHWLSRHGTERVNAVARLDLAAARAAPANGREPQALVEARRRARSILREAPPLAVGDLALDGRDLIGMGMKPGPRFGDILDELLAWVLDDPARNERAALEDKAVEIAAREEVPVTGGDGG